MKLSLRPAWPTSALLNLARLASLVMLLTVGLTSPVAAQPVLSSPFAPLSAPGSDVLSGPSLSLDGRGQMAAAWSREISDGGTVQVEASSRVANGTWSAPVRLGDGHLGGIGSDAAGNTTVVFADPYDASASTRTIWSVTRRAGESWGAPEAIFTADGQYVGSPELAVSLTGETVVAWASAQKIRARSRSSAGAPWSQEATVGDAFINSATSWPAAVIDSQGAATVLWLGPNGVQTSRRFAGSTWEEPVTLSASDHVVPQLAVGASGYVTAFVEEGWDLFTGQFTTRSRTRTGAWGPAVMSPPVGRIGNGPIKMAVGPDDSTTAIWVSGRSCAVQTADLPKGGTWSPVVALTTDCFSDPNVALGPTGNATAIWSPNGSSDSDGVYVTTRTMGAAWSQPLRVFLARQAFVSDLITEASGATTLVGIFEDLASNSFSVRAAIVRDAIQAPSGPPPVPPAPDPIPDSPAPAPPASASPSAGVAPTPRTVLVPTARLSSTRIGRGKALTIRLTGVPDRAKLAVTWKPKRGKAVRQTVGVSRGRSRVIAPKKKGRYRVTVAYQGRRLIKSVSISIG